MAVIAAGRAVEDRAIVPHDQHVGLPDMGIAKRLAALPLDQFVKQRQAFAIVEPVEADDIARAAEQALAARFGMGADEGMQLRFERLVARADIHAAVLVVCAVHALRRVARTGAVDRLQPFDARAKVGGHRVERGVLVGEFGAAADGRYGDAEEAGAGRRAGLKAPVAVPVFGEKRRGFVGFALHRDDMVVAGDRANEGIVAEAAEITGETLEIRLAHFLVGEGEDMMIEPCGADVGDRSGVERLREVDAGHARAARLAAGDDGERHGKDAAPIAACGQSAAAKRPERSPNRWGSGR